MQAIVNDSCPFAVITACGGAEFRKDQYMPVPAGMEDEARGNSFLTTDEDEGAPVLTPLPEAEVLSAEAPPGTVEGEIDATDSAISLAEELGIDLSEVQGTGADGRILKTDVVLYAEALSSAEPEEG